MKRTAVTLVGFEKQSSHGEESEDRHRGVSTLSFSGGAIRFCARASRRKRFFFSRRRDTPVFVLPVGAPGNANF